MHGKQHSRRSGRGDVGGIPPRIKTYVNKKTSHDPGRGTERRRREKQPDGPDPLPLRPEQADHFFIQKVTGKHHRTIVSTWILDKEILRGGKKISPSINMGELLFEDDLIVPR